MALDKNKLENAILNAYDSVSDVEITPATARKQVAAGIATAVDEFVRSAMVTVDKGIEVKTTGSASAQTGATTATGKGSLS